MHNIARRGSADGEPRFEAVDAMSRHMAVSVWDLWEMATDVSEAMRGVADGSQARG